MNIQTEPTSVPYVIPLYNLTRADISRVGAKAANLGELAHAGFPVPDGFAVTTYAFDRFLNVNALDETQSPETVAKAELPPEIQEALHAASAKLNGAPLAGASTNEEAYIRFLFGKTSEAKNSKVRKVTSAADQNPS